MRENASAASAAADERAIDALAARWAANGDTRLAEHLATLRHLAVNLRAGTSGPRAGRPTLDLSAGDSPSPTTTPDAIIYTTSTVPYVNGSTATIVSTLTYFGNIGITTVTYGAKGPGSAIAIATQSVTNRGLGANAPCIGSVWQCVWVFKLQTFVTVNLGSSCGVTLTVSGSHTAQWTTPTVLKLPGATWGSVFASDPTASADNGPCAPPPTCQDGTATNYGAPLPCTYPPPPPSGTGTSPTSGTGYPGETYMPPTYVPGYWNCTIWNYGTPYVIQNCVWVPGYYRNRLPTSPASLARLVAPGTSSRTQSGAELPSVFVIVSDQVPADAIAVIERHRTGPLKNVLLVPSGNIRPAVFVALMQALYDSRAKDGEAPAKDLSLILRGTILDQQIASADRDYAATFTAQIASAKRGEAAGYGNVPIVEFKLGDKK